MTYDEDKDIFTEEIYGLAYGLAEKLGILFNNDSDFSHIACDVWDELPNEVKDEYCRMYSSYYDHE